MFRKRIVAVCFATSAALVGGLIIPRSASAQEVLNLDEEAPAKPGKGGGKAAGKADKTGKKAGSVDIDLDEGGGKPAPGPVTAGQPSEASAAAKKLFDKERWSEASLALHRVV